MTHNTNKGKALIRFIKDFLFEPMFSGWPSCFGFLLMMATLIACLCFGIANL